MKNFLKNISRICFKPVKDEIKEVFTLNPTEKDFEQGQKLAVIVVAVLSANGIPMSQSNTELIGKALAYLVRDIKEGVDDKDKLLVSRVVQEIKRLHK